VRPEGLDKFKISPHRVTRKILTLFASLEMRHPFALPKEFINHFRGVGKDGRIMLKIILKKQDVKLWNDFRM
jgi:hypothetical protein